ncbi:MAG: tetratricopeptide repeat protein [Ignavibacteria bacterium]|nr:tetratricopeptide repeat protein [Ignavibacteria bacterium]
MNNHENIIPSGNVTFLFTDIEGSTKLSQEFPHALPAALEKHHSILIKAIESNNGFIFQNVGDAFCCAFGSSEDAVKAAVEIQINLANENWDEAVIRIRIGIHSGNAEWNGKNYMGYITLARAARVMSAAYGGQILVSNDAYKSCKDNCEKVKEKDISFRDLGERRLKDVIEPIRLYQVLSKELREEFPPLKTLDARPNNLPIQLTSFIGREKELKDVKDKLRQNRLLTLTGTGGSGKSRLSLQAGADLIDDFENGVWFVELAAVSDPEFLTAAIINALGIKEEPKKTPEETLTDHLKDKEILIILDNCEHLISACADLTERLLTSCSKLKIIATSREALNCAGEQIFKIPALTHPDPNSKDTPEQLTQYESVRLFIERALSVNPKFRVNNENAPALAEVCSRLDGIPLAIELAAARTKVLSVEKIYERLDDRFNLLTGGKRTALPRQQTLRALIDWSYDLLTENEKILWSRLSVFSGGWTLEAAEEICSDEIINKNNIIDQLSELSEKSIINYNESRERYNILETIKQYGREKLENENEIFLKHLDHFLELAQKAETELNGSDPKLWLDIIEADHNNFIFSIEWSLSNENIEKGAVIATALEQFWKIRGHYSTGIRLYENILQLDQGNYEEAKKYYEESLVTRKEIGDKSGISITLHNLGILAFVKGDYEQAKKFNEDSLAIRKEIGDKHGISFSLQNLGHLALEKGYHEKAKKYFEESLCIRKEIGDKNGIAYFFNYLGNLANYRGDKELAKKYYEDSLKIFKEIGDKRGIADSHHSQGNLASEKGDFALAKNFFEEEMAIRKEIGDKSGISELMIDFGRILAYQRDFELAVKLLSTSEKIIESIEGVLDKSSRLLKDETKAKLREQLSEEEFNKYWEEGKKLTLEEACQLAVSFRQL